MGRECLHVLELVNLLIQKKERDKVLKYGKNAGRKGINESEVVLRFDTCHHKAFFEREATLSRVISINSVSQ